LQFAICNLPRQRGLTLVELLAVIIILTTIVAAAIPILAPTSEDRRLREATRALNTFITGAQARAISLNRPYGIALKRLAQDTDNDNDPNDPHDDNGVCLEVFYVEQAPPFAGFDRTSKACVANAVPQLDRVLVSFVKESPGGQKLSTLPIGITPDLFPGGMFRPGDVIEILGSRFALLPNTTQNTRFALDQNGFFTAPSGGQGEFPVTILAQRINDSGQQMTPQCDNLGFAIGKDRPPQAPPNPVWPYWTEPAPYRILRQATLTSDEPYQLPEGTAIDLRASGVGSDEQVPGRYFFVPGMTDNSHYVFIMFAPEGSVSRVTFSLFPLEATDDSGLFDQPAVDNVFLLVG
jgi:prepilin-type N-terminal cleavage/methylation domain-containing protein